MQLTQLQNINWKIAGTQGAAVILCALCLVLPSYQWYSIPDTTLVKWLAGLTAFALCICKLTFIPLAWDIKAVNKTGAACLFFAAIISLAVSVSATRDLLNQQTINAINNETVNSLAFNNAQEKLNGLNTEITLATQSLSREIATGCRDHCQKERTQLDALKQQRNKASGELESLLKTAPNSTGATFGKNLTIGTSEHSVTLQAATSVALSLHLTCILSVLCCGAWQPEKTGTTLAENVKAAGRNRPKPKSETKPKPPQANGSANELTDAQTHLAKELEAGQHGDEFALRELIENKAMRGGYKKIKPVIDHLESTGKIRRQGNRYQLLQTTI